MIFALVPKKGITYKVRLELFYATITERSSLSLISLRDIIITSRDLQTTCDVAELGTALLCGQFLIAFDQEQCVRFRLASM